MTTYQLPHKNRTIAFVGAGNMAKSLMFGLTEDDANVRIQVADPEQAQLDVIRQHWPDSMVTTDNEAVVENADVLILAVKPQIMSTVAQSLAEKVQEEKPLVVSIAAGVTEENLNNWLGGDLAIVRCMPNTPALVQCGATGLYANENVSDEQSLAESILRAVGIALWFEEEEKLDVVTATAGSAPAYFFLVMEAMQAAAEQLGLDAESAKLLIIQTALGSAKLAMESTEEPAQLRKNVTSKGGTTEAALKVMNEGGLPELFADAMRAATERSKELSKM